MNKDQWKDLEELKRQYDFLEEEQDFVKKARQKMEAFLDDWHDNCREELNLLDEVVYISQGTPSNQKATLALVNQEAQNNRTNWVFENFYEKLAEYQKRLATQMRTTEAEIDTRKREVEAYAKN